MNPRWKIYFLYTVVIIIGGSVLSILVETVRAKNTGFETKTLWDWMELLIIPFVLAIGAFYLNRSERTVERRIAEDRSKQDREIATDRQQEAALQAYLDRMADLLVLQGSENESVWNVARIRTLTVLRGLDAKRKGIVLLFLDEAGLIDDEGAIISLAGADFSKVELNRTDLSGANLSAANLFNARLYRAKLVDANLSNADLTETDLPLANLTRANLSNANLTRANLSEAELPVANLTGANLSGANLRWANLADADLTAAYLGDADLSNADLSGAKVSDNQLSIAGSLKDAIMPNETEEDEP